MKPMIQINIFTWVLLTIDYNILHSFDIKLPKTNIVHTTSGLVLQYLSEYKPANRIVTFTVAIPMVSDTCYLIPISSMKKYHNAKI